ncbi:multidrug resistance protein [Purpureocillium lavendulum]|uniref:Multidrug resistance protein n=1 Tax=Purpureocillium lavendulum TaxID=1247861 RepID=A0AB34G5V0_9HYPO|nr:multidrug resistance protein [Purpureocillium lavendulum]
MAWYPSRRTTFIELATHDDMSDDAEKADPSAEDASDTPSPLVVSWDGPSDPANPMNWTWQKKWTTTILVSCFTFISPFSSTMVAPALDDIGRDLNITPGFSQALVMSIFLLGYAQGPFVLAPLSEVFGRVVVLQYANLVYLAFNTACGFAQTRQQMLAFRFLSGIGGSAPQALCNGVLADCWSKEERGKGQTIYGMLTFLGPVVAPIAGAYTSLNASWRWIFWATSVFDVLVQVAAFFFLSETYAPRILSRKAKHARKQTGLMYKTQYDDDRGMARILRRRLVLPLIMLISHPAVLAPSIYRAYLYGVMYLVLSTFPQVWSGTYGMDKGTASLNYLSLGVGFMIGLQISHPLIDKLYARYKVVYNKEEGCPEWRVPPMAIGSILAPAGLFIYGWTAQARIHWAVPNVGCALLAVGLIVAFQSAQAYVVDAYSARHAASAAAVGAFLRTMCGFGFPLFAPAMYDALGLGWGNSLLAFATLGLAVASPLLLWCYGERLRRWSRLGLDDDGDVVEEQTRERHQMIAR